MGVTVNRMVRYFNDEGVFEGPIEKVWRLVSAHTPDNVHHIHAGFAKMHAAPDAKGGILASIQLRGPDGKVVPAKMRFVMSPPFTQTVEFLEGPFAGSWSTNTYVPEGNRTRVVCVGEFRIPGLDDASVLKLAGDFMDHGFEEDQAYLRKMA